MQVACRVLGVSASGYYEWRGRPASARSLRHEWVTELIKQVHHDSRETYGARRVHAELTLGRSVPIGHQAVEMLMRRAGIAGVSGRPRYRRVPNQPTAMDAVRRDFHSSEPNRLWVTDITEHKTREGKVYCAAVLDVYSRRIVGWSIDTTPTSTLVSNALGMAVQQRKPEPGAVIHSDQGTQGGFNRSSQHFNHEVLQCKNGNGENQIGLVVPPCARPGARPPHSVKSRSDSGRRLLAACPARKLPWPAGFLHRWEFVGSGIVEVCHRSA